MTVSRLRQVLCLGLSQTIAWASSTYLPAVLAAPVAADLGISQTVFFGAFSFALVVMAALGPAVGRAIDRRGGRGILCLSNLVLIVGLLFLGTVSSLPGLFLAWAVIGAGMALGLYDAAFAALVRQHGLTARGPITGITLLGGFASTIGWPLTAFLVGHWDWRLACFAWAGLHACAALPLNFSSLPALVPAGDSRGAMPARGLAADSRPPAPAKPRRDFVLLAIFGAATAFVTSAMAAHLPGFLAAAGAGSAAVGAAALVGPAQVLARLGEFGAAHRFRLHPLLSARFASALHPAGGLVLVLCGGGPAAAMTFAMLHGAGNGLITIAKGTLPLALFGAKGYGARQGWLAVAQRGMQAGAPLVFALVLERGGAGPALALSMGMALLAAIALLAIEPGQGARDDGGLAAPAATIRAHAGQDSRPPDGRRRRPIRAATLSMNGPDRMSYLFRYRLPLSALGLLLAVFLGLRQITDPDIWFHLVIGREIAALGALPGQEFYIFPALGEPAHYPAAGFGLLQYCIHALGGWWGLAICNALALVGTLWLLYRAATVGTPPGPAVALALAIVLVGLNLRFVYRPEILLYLLLGLQLWILERWIVREERRTLWLLPFLSWFITQFHTTWVLLFLVFGAYATHRLVALVRQPARAWPAIGSEAAFVLLLAVLMLVLPVANPYGLAQVKVLVGGFAQGGNALTEYLPIYQTEYWPHFLVLAVAVGGAGLASRSLRACDIFMLLGLGTLAVLNARNIALFALACAIPLARAMTRLSARLERTGPRLGLYGLAAGIALAAIAAAKNWGIGPKPGTVPEAGARAIQSQLRGGQVFNFFHLGGYLAWQLGPNFKLAMDGHFVRPTAADPLHDSFFRADPGWRQVAERFAVGAIVTPATLPYSGDIIPLVRELAVDPGWRLVAVEEAGLTFLRETPGITAPALPKGLVWEQVRREAEATLADYPGQPGARASLELARAMAGGRSGR